MPRQAARNLPTAAINKAPAQRALQTIVAIKPINGVSPAANHVLMQTLQSNISRPDLQLPNCRNKTAQRLRDLCSWVPNGAANSKYRSPWQVYDTRGIRIGSVLQKTRFPAARLPATGPAMPAWRPMPRHKALLNYSNRHAELI